MIVADTNVIAHLLLPGEHNAAAEALLRRQPRWAAPILWRSEFRSVLTLYMRRGEIGLDDARELAELGEELMRGNEYRVSSGEVLSLASASGCSAYDCEFAALALLEDVPLATTDRDLLRAFPDLAREPESLI